MNSMPLDFRVTNERKKMRGFRLIDSLLSSWETCVTRVRKNVRAHVLLCFTSWGTRRHPPSREWRERESLVWYRVLFSCLLIRRQLWTRSTTIKNILRLHALQLIKRLSEYSVIFDLSPPPNFFYFLNSRFIFIKNLSILQIYYKSDKLGILIFANF